MKSDKLGWIVAAALAGGMVGMGFQGSNVKIGNVDIAKVFNDSDYVKKQLETLKGMQAARVGVIDFMRTNHTMKEVDAEKFKTLSLKENPSGADKTEMERIKAEATANETKFRDLATKTTPTAPETQLLDEFSKRRDANNALMQKWGEDFHNDLGNEQEKMRADALVKVKDAVKSVGAAQGFSAVFTDDVAPYTAGDITAEALKAVNKK